MSDLTAALAILAGLVFAAGVLADGTLQLYLFCLTLILVVRRLLRELDGVGGMGDYRQ